MAESVGAVPSADFSLRDSAKNGEKSPSVSHQEIAALNTLLKTKIEVRVYLLTSFPRILAQPDWEEVFRPGGALILVPMTDQPDLGSPYNLKGALFKGEGEEELDYRCPCMS